MFDWTDSLCIQAQMTYPHLRYFIAQSIDLGDTDALLELLFALNFEQRMDV